MQAYFVQIVIALVISLVAYALTPKPKINRPEAGSLETPKMKAGTPIPVVFGTVRIKSPSIVWYGDASTSKIRTKSGK